MAESVLDATGVGEEGAERAGARWRRVTMSGRDWELLAWAHEQKFLLFGQVARWFPEGPPNPKVAKQAEATLGTKRRQRRPGNWYIQERLRKLVRFDVLRRVPVYTEPAAALLPGRLGFELLEGTGRSHDLDRLSAIDWKNYAHDRAVTDLRWRLACPASAVARSKVTPKATAWKSERVLRRELPAGHVPDALLTLDGRTVALELELTRKSTARYVSVLQRYLAWPGPHLDAVLYVVPTSADLQHLFGVILPAALRKSELWGARQPDLRLFRFTTEKGLEAGKVWSTGSMPSAPAEGSLWTR